MSKVAVGTKFAYGLGQVGEAVKSGGFNTFLFFFFTQVLGLSGTLAGAAILIALVFDAITDPIAGSMSDNWKSKNGRRHPFMYAAALPLGVFYIILFNPPADLGQLGLFGWLTGFTILVRGSMTLYHVPHLALGAELSSDYIERTSIVTWRTVSSMIGGAIVTLIAYRFFFPEIPGQERALLNAAGYPPYAAFAAGIMVVTIWYSAWGTRKEIPRLPLAPENSEPFSFRRLVVEFSGAWKNVSFRSLFIGFTLYGIFFGVATTLGTHINVFFWGFDTVDLSWLIAPGILGFAVGAALVGFMHRRYDKRPTLITACIAGGLTGNLVIVLRLLDLFPAPGSPFLLPAIAASVFVGAVIGAWGFVSAGSMMADVADQYQLQTGKAQQGIFFSATSFSGKLASGMGHFFAGVGLDLIAFPLQAPASEVPAAAIQNLGLLNLSSLLLIVGAIYIFRFYNIDRDGHEQTRVALAAAAHLPTGQEKTGPQSAGAQPVS
jgi:GPH family glycoside/pentoside/hexuronide:cation symporter